MEFQSTTEKTWNDYKEKIPVTGVIAEIYIHGIFLFFIFIFI